MKKKSSEPSFFSDKRVILVISLVLAFLVWVMVAGFIDPGTAKPIRNVPIDYVRNEAEYQERNLMIVIPAKDQFADVQVTGDGAVLGPLSSSSVAVYADYGLVTEAGTYDVPLRTAKVDPGNWNILEMSTILNGHSLDNPNRMVTITFEEVEAKTMPVTVRADGVVPAPGFFIDNPVASPESVTLRGPQSRVNLVSRVVAEITATEELDERKKYMGVTLVLQDENGQTIDAEAAGISFSPDTVEVDISILVMRELELEAEFTGLPSYFDTEWLYQQVSLSVNQLQVVGPATAFETLSNPFTVGTFAAAQLTMAWESDPIVIQMPDNSGIRITDEQRQVTVSLNTADMAEKTFEVPIGLENVINGPNNASITPVADTITVRMLGPAEQINALLPENITVQIDAFGISAARSGQQTIPARILAPGADRSIPIGGYSILCNVERNA